MSNNLQQTTKQIEKHTILNPVLSEMFEPYFAAPFYLQAHILASSAIDTAGPQHEPVHGPLYKSVFLISAPAHLFSLYFSCYRRIQQYRNCCLYGRNMSLSLLSSICHLSSGQLSPRSCLMDSPVCLWQISRSRKHEICMCLHVFSLGAVPSPYMSLKYGEIAACKYE